VIERAEDEEAGIWGGGRERLPPWRLCCLWDDIVGDGRVEAGAE